MRWRACVLSGLAGLGLLLLTGCQEFQGPAWSPDGQWIAYTEYRRTAEPGKWEPRLLLADPDDATGATLQIAKDAAFPRWVTDGPSLYFLGERDAQGYYNAVYKYTLGRQPPAEVKPEVLLRIQRLVNLQMSNDGTVGLVAISGDPKPGRPQALGFWSVREGKVTPLTDLGEVFSPVLFSNGKAIAYATQAAQGQLPQVVVLDLDRQPLKPRVVFPTLKQNEPHAISYVVHVSPSGDRLLFYAPDGKNIWSVRRDGTQLQSTPMLPGYTFPLLVSFMQEGRAAVLTFGKIEGRGFQFQAHELSFATGRLRLLEGSAPDLVGGVAPDPNPNRNRGVQRSAWLSAGGLAVGVAGKARFYPQNAAQFLAASKVYVKQGEPERAIATVLKAREHKPGPDDPAELDLTEARAYAAAAESFARAGETKRAVECNTRAIEAYTHSLLLNPVGSRGLAYLFPAEKGLPSPAANERSALAKELEPVIAAATEANPDMPLLLKPLHGALAARLAGDGKKALEAYRQAFPMCGSPALAGGVKFQEGLLAIEGGDMAAAGEALAAAARAEGFPQNDYAAGLAATALMLHGYPQSEKKAESLLRYGQNLQTSLKDELAKLAGELKGKTFMQKRATTPVFSQDHRMSVWVDVSEYLVPQAFLRPEKVMGPDRKYAERRLGAALMVSSAIGVAGLPEGAQTVLTVPRPISQPLFSPSGDLLAFLVQGEVLPLSETFCSAFVADVRGRILLGDPNVLTGTPPISRQALTSLLWVSPRELRVQGQDVDYFGGQTAYDKRVTIARP